MTFGRFILALAILAGGYAALRPVALDVERRLPQRQRDQVAAARRAAAARTAPARRRARDAAARARAVIEGASRHPVWRHFIVRPPAPQPPPAPAGAADTRPATAPAAARPPNVVDFRPRPAPSAPDPAEAPAVTTPTRDVLTPGGAGADLFAAVQHIIGHASAGGVQAKERALLQFTEALGYVSDALDGFARRLAEPDQHYAAAVWEHVGMAGAHVRAASMSMSEASSALRHVLSLTVGEAASSGMHVPHHEQINSGL